MHLARHSQIVKEVVAKATDGEEYLIKTCVEQNIVNKLKSWRYNYESWTINKESVCIGNITQFHSMQNQAILV